MVETTAEFLRDLKCAARSLARERILVVTIVVTLALGIGANAAMFTLLRGVLLRPLVNRDEARLIYIRQTAGGENATFSVPEIADLSSRLKTLNSFGDFSVIGFTMVGLGEPRSVQAGVVGGSYFQVMGLRPVLGRLLDAHDDGPKAAGAVVLTYRFWTTDLKGDPSVIGKTVKLGSFADARAATVVGVLEPCVPYPQDTQIIANIVSSEHHLSATMQTIRVHRMTDLFARLAPGANLDQARAELASVYGGMKREHPEDYPAKADFRISATRLRDQLTSGARGIVLGLMGASLLVFIIACSNVANLILARSVRRENELGIRAALGASAADLRRSLLAESLLLCVGGAAVGMLIAEPMVGVLARYASRYSVRALDLSMDSSMLWVGAGLAVAAAALLAFVPRLPSSGGARAFALSSGNSRITGATGRKLKIFALVQMAASFMLVAAAAATVETLVSLQAVKTGFDTRHVLAVDVPLMRALRTPSQEADYFREAARKIRELPGVLNVASGGVPWRDANDAYQIEFSLDSRVRAREEEPLRAHSQVVSPGYFAALGLPLLEGRDFNDADRNGGEPVAIVSQSMAQRMLPGRDVLGHHVTLTDPLLLQFARVYGVNVQPARIVGVAPDVDNFDLKPKPTATVYQAFDQQQFNGGGHLLINSSGDPYALVTPVTRILRDLSADQPVEHAMTLQDVRAEVLSPERLNAVVSGVFAGVALLIAVVGVAGVLAFSVSGRVREFGIRLAVGAQPKNLLLRVIAEGAAMAVGGLALGAALGYSLAEVAASYIGDLKMPGAAPLAGSALALLIAAVAASAIPAVRAARIDVIQALRSE